MVFKSQFVGLNDKVKYCLLLLILVTNVQLMAQNDIVWGTKVFASDTFSYWEGSQEPNALWRNLNFNDGSWKKGPGGFGYGDGDDQTVLNNLNSVMVRKSFNIDAVDSVIAGVFCIDYDDGFVAYLNGIEIARGNMNPFSSFPSASTFASGNHEAQLYQGGAPDQYKIATDLLDSLLVIGKNVLAVQVHNVNSTSSDLSCAPFLMLGSTKQSNPFSPLPSWFNEPFVFDTSHLPIIVINTNGLSIQDEPEIEAEMGVVINSLGLPNSVNGPFNHYTGKINIELRGESSLWFDKKSYKIETIDNQGNNLNVPLLGLPAENDWILYGPYSDKSLLRNVITFELAQAMEVYASRTRFFELVINDDYKGLYVLMEKIKEDKNRLDIAKLNPEDTVGEEITGGYIFRVDKIEPNGSPGFYSNPNPVFPSYDPNYFQYYDPKFQNMTQPQTEFIRDYVESAESALTSSSFLNPTMGYKKYFDLLSFCDYQIINELTKNVDGYRFSTYFHKDKNDPIQAGPFWDFNLAFGNVDYWNETVITTGWIYPYSDRLWWTKRMLEDPEYINSLHCRWNELREGDFSNHSISFKIDSIVNHLGPAIERNFSRWNILGTYVWPNNFIGATHDEEIQEVKNWIINRAHWLDGQWTQVCAASVSEKNIVETPLVFPNPFTEHIWFEELPSEFKQVKLINLQGQEVWTKNLKNLSFPLKLTPDNVSPGFYMLQLEGESTVHAQPIVKL